VTVLQWTGEFRIDHGTMDEIHVEFVEQLNALGAAEEDMVLSALDDFVAHTERHFADEEAWMADCAFPRIHCHTQQHGAVLQVAREVRVRMAAGETTLAPLLATPGGAWFREHVATMDLMLANCMTGQGYVPRAEMRRPERSPVGRRG